MNPAPRRAGLELPVITDKEFKLFRELIERVSGIHLEDSKRTLLVSRLTKRLRTLELKTFAAYYERVSDPEGASELQTMLDCVCTNETHFFREPQHFTLLERTLIPRWQADAEAGLRTRHLRVWSAACSTGEEPFTLAMTLSEKLPAGTGWTFEILATDLSTRVLERAESATWPIQRAEEIPRPLLSRYMLRGTGPEEGRMRAVRELRELITFRRMNLSEESYPVGSEPFDLIFCRNVLIYFDAATRRRVVRQLAERLTHGGHLFLGHAESLAGHAAGLVSVMPTVYQHPRGGRG